MAKSLYEILSSKTIDVIHRGSEITLNLPSMFDDVPSLDDFDALTDWASDHGVLHQLMQAGFRDWVIKIRAIARPDDETHFSDVDKHDKLESIKSQERLDEMKFKLMTKPGTGGTKVSKALQKQREELKAVLIASGIDETKITEALEKIK